LRLDKITKACKRPPFGPSTNGVIGYVVDTGCIVHGDLYISTAGYQ